VLGSILGDDQRALTQIEALQLLDQGAGLGGVHIERFHDLQAVLAVQLGQDGADGRAVHLAVDLLREAARLGREGHAAADEDRSAVVAVTRAAALLLLRLLGGAVDFRTGLLRLGARATGVAVGDDDLVDQVLAEVTTEHGVGDRDRLVAVVDGEFHRGSP